MPDEKDLMQMTDQEVAREAVRDFIEAQGDTEDPRQSLARLSDLLDRTGEKRSADLPAQAHAREVFAFSAHCLRALLDELRDSHPAACKALALSFAADCVSENLEALEESLPELEEDTPEGWAAWWAQVQASPADDIDGARSAARWYFLRLVSEAGRRPSGKWEDRLAGLLDLFGKAAPRDLLN